jgi:hypothetical protein
MGVRVLGSLGVAVAVGIACGTAGAFACETDADCLADGVQGACEAVGFCSFPDGACASGRRFGGHAGGGLAGACVEPDGSDGVGTGDSTGGSASISSSGTSTTAGAESTTFGVEGSESASITSSGGSEVGSSSSSGGVEGSGSSSGRGESSSGGGEMLACTFDPFETGFDASSCDYADVATAIGAQDGMLVCEVFAAGFPPTGAYAGLTTCELADLSGIVATIEVVQAPAPEPQLVLLMEVNDGDSGLGIAFEEGELFAYAYVDGSYTTHATVAYDAGVHRFWRLEDEGGAVQLSTSSDNASWDVLDLLDDTVPVLPNGRLSITCGAELAPAADTAARVDDAEVCLPR